jgi:sugar phosphate isomerase/epimerase
MLRILSTYRYVNQPLTSAIVSSIAHAGVGSIEIFCSPVHLDYRSLASVKELGDMLGEVHLELYSLHAPTERNLEPGRESGVPISISDTERIRRIDAVDEVKRALEVAERIPFRYLVQHMGHRRQAADPWKLDAAFTSLEHLSIFAKERGVVIALENTPDELGSPESLQQFIKETHLHDLKLCFDIGHANVADGVQASFEIMRDKIVTSHIHDNHGEKDEHLLPYDGDIDWDAALKMLASAPHDVPLVLELKEHTTSVSAPSGPSGAPHLEQVREVFDKLEKRYEDTRADSVRA